MPLRCSFGDSGQKRNKQDRGINDYIYTVAKPVTAVCFLTAMDYDRCCLRDVSFPKQFIESRFEFTYCAKNQNVAEFGSGLLNTSYL